MRMSMRGRHTPSAAARSRYDPSSASMAACIVSTRATSALSRINVTGTIIVGVRKTPLGGDDEAIPEAIRTGLGGRGRGGIPAIFGARGRAGAHLPHPAAYRSLRFHRPPDRGRE